MPRKIRDEADALACLNAVEASGVARAVWAHQHGIDARSMSDPSTNPGGILRQPIPRFPAPGGGIVKSQDTLTNSHKNQGARTP